jgi:hypothetical protein
MEPVSGKASGVKTLGIKLDPDLHAQFSLVAQLDELSLGDALRRAVELYVAGKQAQPDFAARAQAALEAIEAEAAARRGAIQALFGGQSSQNATATGDGGGKTSRRRGSETNS